MLAWGVPVFKTYWLWPQDLNIDNEVAIMARPDSVLSLHHSVIHDLTRSGIKGEGNDEI